MTRRGEGDLYEEYVYHTLKPFLNNLRTTVGSGSVFGDQDLFSDEARISVKQRSNKGLTEKEILLPYNKEAIGSIRWPLTVLRVIYTTPEEVPLFGDYAILDVPEFIAFYGRPLVTEAFAQLDAVVELPDWKQGCGLALLSKITWRELLLVHNLPSGSVSAITTLHGLMDVLAYMREGL